MSPPPALGGTGSQASFFKDNLAKMSVYSNNSGGIPVQQPVRSRSATIFSAGHPGHHGASPTLPGTVTSGTVNPNGKGTMSCPNLLFVRSEPLEMEEFHRKLQLTVTLSDASQRLALTESYSRHRLSQSSSRGASPHRGELRHRNTSSSVSSFRSSSENETISCDESTELDISKVIPEIKIDDTGPHVPFSDRNAAEVLDFLFIGDLESANREPLLCRLNVECVVELINLSPHEVRKTIKLKDCPCVCASPMKHTRIRLSIFIDDSIQEDVVHYFDEINQFIHGAYKTHKNVLVYCLNGTSLAPTIAIQYLMQYQGMRLKDAYSLLKQRRPQTNLPGAFQSVLTRLERQLRPTSPTGFIFEKEFALSAKTPEAWT
ncbi:uncharacterized protein [Amphiura filiformis]|uniref:uncharacterized protein n=1 Tax=Amphiura filiformis TaxID=82378 RepID=UPI003B21F355